MKVKPAAGIAAALALFALTWAGSANAAVTVANTADSGPGSLREAIKDAPPGETINVPAGTYSLTSGPLTINKTLTLAGAGSGTTTITSAGDFRMIQSAEGDLTLSGLALRGAHVKEVGGGGGVIYSQSHNLTLRGVTIADNTVDVSGGPGESGGVIDGYVIQQSGGKLALIDSQVTGNRGLARGGSGKNGGIIDGGISVIGALELRRSNISGNLADASGGQGPASAAQNGGIVDGGAIEVSVEGTERSTIVDSTLSGNTADVSGGPGSNNGIAEGGAINFSSSEGSLAIENTTIAGNAIRGVGETSGILYGGGAHMVATKTASVSFRNATVAANRIESPVGINSGGNLYMNGAFSFQSTIVTAGVGAEAASTNCFSAETPTSLGFNIDSTEQCDFGTSTDLNNTDPQLGPLQDNGGPGPTMLPAASSPAVDRGAPGLIGDERAVPRPIDFPTIPNAIGSDGSDIGAVELQPASGLTLGKLTRNKKKGTATLVVSLPQPSVGSLGLTGKGLKPQTLAITGQDRAVLKILPVGKVKKALRKKGKRKVGISVSYAPTANAVATATLKPKLLKKHKKRHKKHHGKHHKDGKR
jgi:hypothetical protein